MNDYMRENKIEPVAPQLGTQAVVARSDPAPAEDDKRAPKPAAKPSKHDS